jgi:phage shock protein C
MANRLYRSRRDRMLAGVAGGLAELWGADPSLVRIIWALLVVFTGGVALLIYIVMAVVVPEEEDVYPGGAPVRAVAGEERPRTGRGSGLSPAVLIGGFLVLLGGFFLMREFLPQIDFDWVWPLILVAIGVVLIASAMGRGAGPRAGGPPASPPPASPPSPPSPPTSPPPTDPTS